MSFIILSRHRRGRIPTNTKDFEKFKTRKSAQAYLKRHRSNEEMGHYWIVKTPTKSYHINPYGVNLGLPKLSKFKL